MLMWTFVHTYIIINILLDISHFITYYLWDVYYIIIIIVVMYYILE